MGLHSQLRLLDGLLTHSLSLSHPLCFFIPSSYKLCLSPFSVFLPPLDSLTKILSDSLTSPFFRKKFQGLKFGLWFIIICSTSLTIMLNARLICLKRCNEICCHGTIKAVSRLWSDKTTVLSRKETQMWRFVLLGILQMFQPFYQCTSDLSQNKHVLGYVKTESHRLHD